MQPFGLLHFLQSALSPKGDNQPSSAPPQEEIVADAANTSPQDSPPPQPSKGEDAYQAFLAKHEQFARRIRKKN